MEKINWIQVIIGFLSGGAFGALIKQYFDNRRNRIQPISYSIDLKSFYNSIDTKLINTKVTLNEDETEYKFSNLYTGTIEIINTGLSDYSEFPFGLTLDNTHKFIHLKSTTTDRHHIIELSNNPSLSNQVNSFDIILKPFNRKDRYVFDLLLTSSNSFISDKSIQISTSKPIKMTKLSTTGEAILAYTNKTFLQLLYETFKSLLIR